MSGMTNKAFMAETKQVLLMDTARELRGFQNGLYGADELYKRLIRVGMRDRQAKAVVRMAVEQGS